MQTSTSQGTVNNEISILQRVAVEDKMAIEECLSKYGKLVWSMALHFTHSREDAEDAVQDIFIDIWKYAGRFDAQKSAESTFIALIARRRLIDQLRKMNRQPVLICSGEGLQNFSDEAGEKIQSQIEAKEVARHLNQLNPQQQKVLKMAIYEGMSQTEIAEKIGLPLGTVKSLIRRGFQKIRTNFPGQNNQHLATAV